MSKVASRFWNSKVHKQLDAKKQLKALGILTGDEAEAANPLTDPAFVLKTRQVGVSTMMQAMSYQSPLLKALGIKK